MVLAQDDSPEWLAWQHAVKWLEERCDNFDVFVSLPTTSPLRNKEDVTKCLTLFSDETDVVIGMTESVRSPWFNMVHKKENGFIEILLKSDNSYTRRQDTPAIFDITTVAYVSRPGFISNATGIFEGKVKGVEIPAERALDIDTELDWDFVDFMMTKIKKNND